MKMFLGQIELLDSYKLVVNDYRFQVYDDKGNLKYYENSKKQWEKCEYDDKGNLKYYENSDKYWEKYERDKEGKVTYWENLNGVITDKRVKKMTLQEIEDALGYKVEVVK